MPLKKVNAILANVRKALAAIEKYNMHHDFSFGESVKHAHASMSTKYHKTLRPLTPVRKEGGFKSPEQQHAFFGTHPEAAHGGQGGGKSGHPRLAAGYSYGHAIHPSTLKKGDTIYHPGNSRRGQFGGEVVRVNPKTVAYMHRGVQTYEFDPQSGRGMPVTRDIKYTTSQDNLHGGYVQRGNKVHPISFDAKVAKSLTHKSVSILPGGEGKPRRMVIISSNAYKDREDDTVTSKALEDYVSAAYSDGSFQRQPLMYWHEYPIGQVIGAEFIKPFLVEVAEEQLGDKVSKAVWDACEQSNGDGWGASIGFHAEKPADTGNTYQKILKIETSILPQKYAANPYTLSKVD